METNPSLIKNIDKLLLILNIVNRGAVIIAVCNNSQLQNEIIALIQNKYETRNSKFVNIKIDEINESLINRLETYSINIFPSSKVVYSVTGIENTDTILQINLKRDFFYEFKYPVIFWVNSEVLKQIMLKAPDFWHIRTKMIEFKLNDMESNEIMFSIQDWKPENQLYDNG